MDKTQVNFEELRHISNRLADEGEDLLNLTAHTRRMVESLLYDGWLGLGADHFYDEMYEVVLPAMHRLSEALSDAALTSQKIGEIYGKAQADAAEGFIHFDDWRWPDSKGGGT